MTQSQTRDEKIPILRPTEKGLRAAVDENSKIQVRAAKPLSHSDPIDNLALALQGSQLPARPVTNCHRKFWFSYFFDGTGNNMSADIGFLKHSNIVRLFRVHRENNVSEGVYKIYIPGVGTYFRDVGDDGGSALGLGCGAMGEARINFALREFSNIMAEPLAQARNQKNAIEEINLAVFGFSRGAALARAFMNDFINRNCIVKQGRWVMKQGGWHVRIRFVGLFDTVASVGVPLSSNNMPISGTRQAYGGNIQGMIKNRIKEYPDTRPAELAFFLNGIPGADPVPGRSAGHNDWGSRLEINELVEVVHHFVAAHELRNSFPLDSISSLGASAVLKPAHFYETVYPGAHSDVGGGYAPGEGGKGILPTENLALIPLRHMYQHAMRSGVPMLPEFSWKQENKEDFEVSPNLRDAFNHYLKEVGKSDLLGHYLNKNMRLFFAWRFKAIRNRRADGKLEAQIIHKFDSHFQKRAGALQKEVSALEKTVDSATAHLEIQEELQKYRDSGQAFADGSEKSESDRGVVAARKRRAELLDQVLQTKARKDSLPIMQNLKLNIELYDKQLIDDVLSISEALDNKGPNKGRGKSRENLRPHYKNLYEAFENEFLKNDGLKDEMIMLFFDKYVHDSLCGFGKDATLPSDPRVIFMGGDAKFRYAKLEDLSPSTMLQHGRVVA